MRSAPNVKGGSPMSELGIRERLAGSWRLAGYKETVEGGRDRSPAGRSPPRDHPVHARPVHVRPPGQPRPLPRRPGAGRALHPLPSALRSGGRSAGPVDALATATEAPALADWLPLPQRRLPTIYTPPGHSGPFLGLPVLLDRFPDARAVATPATVAQMRSQTTPEALNIGDRARYPGQIADTIALAEPLEAEHFELEGHPLVVIETGHTDTVDTTSLHVPDLGLIASGDVAYNPCHMSVGPTTADGRAE